jgi:hypothetical protein
MLVRKIRVHLAEDEWGNDVMWRVAQGVFAEFPNVDLVTVYEYAGWMLGYLRDGTVVESANDGAVFHGKALEFRQKMTRVEVLGEIRRVGPKPAVVSHTPGWMIAMLGRSI